MKMQITCPCCKNSLTVGNPYGNNTCVRCKKQFTYYLNIPLNKVVTEKGRSTDGEIKRRMLWYNNHCKCHYCRKDIEYQQSTLDHVVPTSRGGTDGLHNLVISCHSCNNKKGSEEYGSFVKQSLRTIYKEYPPPLEYARYMLARFIKWCFIWQSKVCYFITLL